MSLPKLWRKTVQQPALWLCCLAVGRPMRCAAVVAALYVLSPWIPSSWIWWLECCCSVILIAAFSIPSAAGTAALTLARRLQFGIRRAYLHHNSHKNLLHANLSKKTNAALALHGPSQMQTPSVIKRLTKQTPYGMTLVYDGSVIGTDDFDFEKAAHVLKSKFSGTLFKGRVKLLGTCKDLFIEPDKRVEHFIRCELIYQDPFKQVITTDMLPPPSHPERVVVGMDERWRPVEKNYKLPQLLAGESGSGKSTEARMQLLGLVRSGIPFLTVVLDPKKTEYVDIKDRAFYYQNNKDIDRFMKTCLQMLEQRQLQLAEIGEPDFPLNDPRFPRILVIIDELITVLRNIDKRVKNISFDGGKLNAEDALMELLSTGRSAGFIVLANTQLIQKAILELVRDLFPYKTFLRLPSVDATRIAFPGEGQARIYAAHTLPKEGAEGIGWMEIEGQITKYRGALPSKAEREEVAEGIGRWTEKYRNADAGSVRESVNA